VIDRKTDGQKNEGMNKMICPCKVSFLVFISQESEKHPEENEHMEQVELPNAPQLSEESQRV